MLIPNRLYKQIQQSIPILCIDVILFCPKRGLYLQKRDKAPHKNMYTLIGGRLHRDEDIMKCVHRQVEESGMQIEQYEFSGYWDWKSIDRRQRSVSLIHVVQVNGEPTSGKFFTKYNSMIPVSVRNCINHFNKGRINIS